MASQKRPSLAKMAKWAIDDCFSAFVCSIRAYNSLWKWNDIRRLFGAKPLTEPMLTSLDHWKRTSGKFESKCKTFHSGKCISKCRLRDGGYFVSALMCFEQALQMSRRPTVKQSFLQHNVPFAAKPEYNMTSTMKVMYTVNLLCLNSEYICSNSRSRIVY